MTELVQKLREAFDYSPDTGVLRWKREHKVYGRLCQPGPAGAVGEDGYLEVKFCRKTLRVHRVIWALVTGVFPVAEIDHRNHSRTDNRWSNLREATHAQNAQNRGGRNRNNKSGFLGVSVHRGRHRATICVNRKCQHLGYFETAEAASAAYIEAKARLHYTGAHQ